MDRMGSRSASTFGGVMFAQYPETTRHPLLPMPTTSTRPAIADLNISSSPFPSQHPPKNPTLASPPQSHLVPSGLNNGILPAHSTVRPQGPVSLTNRCTSPFPHESQTPKLPVLQLTTRTEDFPTIDAAILLNSNPSRAYKHLPPHKITTKHK